MQLDIHLLDRSGRSTQLRRSCISLRQRRSPLTYYLRRAGDVWLTEASFPDGPDDGRQRFALGDIIVGKTSDIGTDSHTIVWLVAYDHVTQPLPSLLSDTMAHDIHTVIQYFGWQDQCTVRMHWHNEYDRLAANIPYRARSTFLQQYVLAHLTEPAKKRMDLVCT